MVHAIVCVMLCLGVISPLCVRAYDVVPTRLSLSYEELRLGGQETMGLLGGSYAVRPGGPIDVGLAVFGAARGERGGFFTGGATAGLHHMLTGRLHFDADVFAGAGGGGSAPQGGGFMLRTHAGLSLDFDTVSVGAGYAWVDFPNGNITSDHLVVSASHPFGLLLGGGWRDDSDIDIAEAVPGTHQKPQVQSFDAILVVASPVGGTRNTAGEAQEGDMAMIGVAWERVLSPGSFLELSVVGSMGGAGDGYAQGVCDLGARVVLSPSLDLVLGGGLGLAGGGKVDTGGGLIGDVFVKLEQSLGRGYHLGGGVGAVGAADGDFLATRLHLDFGYDFETPVPTGGWRVQGSQVYRPGHLRLRLAHQTEQPADGALRKGGTPDRTINLAGLKGDIMITRSLLLSGQVLSAYDGGAGGYAAGLAGLGGEWAAGRRSPWLFGVETLIGAAGGGGIVVDGGLIAQATAGLGYRTGGVTDAWLRLGRSGSLRGSFERTVVSVELGFRFSTLMR